MPRFKVQGQGLTPSAQSTFQTPEGKLLTSLYAACLHQYYFLLQRDDLKTKNEIHSVSYMPPKNRNEKRKKRILELAGAR